MRVKYHPDERVDVPDITAMSGLTESEFRRHISQFHLGYDVGVVLRGFEVEPENPASTRIKVRLDRTADAIPGLTDSLAIAAENLGGTIDFGLLIGGRNSDGNIEGPAQLLADFSTQPLGTYVVEMRASTTTANEEKRAFWNEALNTEYVDSKDTRIVNTWEIRIVPTSTGQEWLPLAQVVWNGSNVSAVDITDGRFLVHEGFAIFGFDTEDQNFAQFEFNRDIHRGQFGVGIPSPMAMLSALQRQILDIKGHNSTGKYNWYGRVFSPPGNESLWLKHTKSLRSIDTVSFTVGIAGDYGDFNGPSGLNDCLNFISAHSLFLPKRIKIVLKSRQAVGAPTPLRFLMTAGVAIANKDLEIINELGNAKSTYVNEPAKDVFGQASIDTSGLPLFATALSLTGRSSLRMENITWEQPSLQIRQVQVSGPVVLRNVVMRGYATDWNFEALTCHSDQSFIDRCYFSGVVNFGGGNTYIHANGGTVRNTEFKDIILRLRSTIDNSVTSVFDLLKGSAQLVTFDGCSIAGRSGLGGVTQISNVGFFDIRGASHLTIKNCRIAHSSEEDGIRLGNLPSGTDGNSVLSNWIEIANNEFVMFADNGHNNLAGVGGSFGSGNHIMITHQNLLAETQMTVGVHIHDNHFFGGVFGVPASPDASAINAFSVRSLKVTNNRFTDWMDSTVPGFNILVRVRNDSFPATDVRVVGNFFGDWTDNIVHIGCVSIEQTYNLYVNDNVFSKYARGAPADGETQNLALSVIACNRFWISGNQFTGWVDIANKVATNCNLGFAGLTRLGHVTKNTFFKFGGAAMYATFAIIEGCEFSENIFEAYSSDAVDNFRAAIDFGGITTNLNTYVGNRWTYAGGPTADHTKLAIHVGNDAFFTVMANHFFRGQIAHATFAGAQHPFATGYAVTTPQLNYVFEYV